MFKKIFKFVLPKGSDEKGADGHEIQGTLKGKIKVLSDFANDHVQSFCKEILTVREKSKNLRQSNYELGLKHIERGELSDAIFRFRFIKKFWPDLYDAQYQLAYCLMLKKRKFQAKAVLEELLIARPDYDKKAQELLDQINSPDVE